MRIRRYGIMLAMLAIAGCGPTGEREASREAGAASATSERYAVIIAGKRVGHLNVERSEAEIAVDYDFKNNGRGPTIKETIVLGEEGVPVEWRVEGVTSFGNKVEESFSSADRKATWTDAGGDGEASVDAPHLYISQFASPYDGAIYAGALLAANGRQMPALPAGALRLTEMERLGVEGEKGAANVIAYALSGAALDPDYIILDEAGGFFAFVSARFAVIREGYEGEEERLRNLAARYGAERFKEMQARYVRRYDSPVRIRNVRVFDPETLTLTAPVSVVVEGETVASVDPLDVPTREGEVEIDGAGGSLLPGLYEMHGHMSDDDALMNLLAGVTSVRDTGNEMDVLEPLRDKIESGALAGPRISMSGFIEGVSETNNATGELASTEEEAVDLVRMYAERGGYHQIKVYSSVKGEWVPAMAREAHARGMRVSGHIPAFSTVDEMIEAGYDEVTHINQVMLSWVLDRNEDTRTLFRITGMRRFADLDLGSEKVQKTINLMVEKGTVVDPTTVIHELGLTSRNGETFAGAVDYIDHMPISSQRAAKVALLNVADAEEDADYRAAFDKIIKALSMMRERGIFLVPGTDLGGAFMLHREIELFGKIGFTPAEALRRASYDMARYLGFEDRGAVAPGMLADFFLVPGDPTADLKAIKTVALVSRGGAFYFPSEIYPEFGITPFTEVPIVRTEGAAAAND